MASWTNPNLGKVIPLFSQGILGGGSIGSITPGTPFTVVNQINVSQFTSYDINLYTLCASPGSVGAPITTQVNLQWFDDLVSGIPVFQEMWFIWNGRAANSAAFNTASGTGPMHGKYLTIQLFIPPGAASNVTVQYVNLFGSSRTLSKSDWRQNAQGVNPQVNGFVIQQGGGTGYDDILASISGAVLGASALVFVPLGLYSGYVYYRYQCNNVPAHDPVIAQVAGTIGGGWAVGTGMTGVLVNIPSDANEHEGFFMMPRSACVFIFQANATSGSTFSLEIAGQSS